MFALFRARNAARHAGGIGGARPALARLLPPRCAKPADHWSKDGATVYFEKSSNLFAFDVASRQTTKLTNFDGSQSFKSDFRFSPDAERIVYTERLEGQRDLWIADKRGGNATRLTNDAAEDDNPVWHADGQRVVYSSPQRP